MKDYHIVSFSGGKDSTAMLLRMIELGMQIDEVINFDTGLEFPDMYAHISKVKSILDQHGIKFTVFKSELGFEHYLLERERVEGTNLTRNGWGWPNIKNRWCTAYLKTRISAPYIRELMARFNVIQYIGIASDEVERMKRKAHQVNGFRYPLVEWGWSEEQCLDYCYNRGLNWNGLYDLFSRVSCWLCPLQPLGELYKLWENFPELWDKLKEWDSRLVEQYGSGVQIFKKPYTIDQLERRFQIEKRRKDANINTSSKNFYKELNAIRNRLPKNQTLLEVD